MVPYVLVMAICILSSFMDVFSSIIAGLTEHQMVLGMIVLTCALVQDRSGLMISFISIPVSYHLSVMSYQKRR